MIPDQDTRVQIYAARLRASAIALGDLIIVVLYEFRGVPEPTQGVDLQCAKRPRK